MHANVESPLGTIHLEIEAGRLRRLKFAGRRNPTARAPAIARALKAYFDGELDAIDDVPVAVEGTPFQERVWAALCRIPAGVTVTYGDLAAETGNPRAARAVGGAVGANPVGIVVPCHRAIASGGALGGYGGGLDRKRWLLRHEGAR